MFTDISNYIRTCVFANAVNAQPLNLPNCCNLCTFLKVYGTASLLTSSLVSKTIDAIGVFVDRPTKHVHLAPTTTKCIAQTWAEMFMQHVFCNHGCPLEVISDRGPQFAGNYTRSLADRLRITWNMFTAFHPQTNGQTERTNRTVEDMLRHLVSPTMTDWDVLLINAQFAINPYGRNLCKTHPSTSTMGAIPGHPQELPWGALFLHRVGILPLQHLHCTCKAHLLVQKPACLLHSTLL